MNGLLYVAITENLFNRLPNRATEKTKFAINKCNLIPAYMRHLALQCITVIEQLIDLCRRLKNAKVMITHYKSPPVSDTYFVKPELSTTILRTRLPPVHAVNYANVEPYKSDPSGEGQRVPEIATINCWNCRQNGHGYLRFPRPRVMFCCGCGNVATRSVIARNVRETSP